jgi:hypothetical protein
MLLFEQHQIQSNGKIDLSPLAITIFINKFSLNNNKYVKRKIT